MARRKYERGLLPWPTITALSHRDWVQICRLLELQDEGMLCLGSVPEVSALPNLLSPSHPLFRKEICLVGLIEVV